MFFLTRGSIPLLSFSYSSFYHEMLVFVFELSVVGMWLNGQQVEALFYHQILVFVSELSVVGMRLNGQINTTTGRGVIEFGAIA